MGKRSQGLYSEPLHYTCEVLAEDQRSREIRLHGMHSPGTLWFNKRNGEDAMVRALEPSDLAAIIEDRARVQTLCLSLLTVLKSNEQRVADDAMLRRIAMLCAGAAFSLWRAVPLVHQGRTPVQGVQTTVSYLEQIVRHNTITYGDDDRSRAWSFGYYLSNARYRIEQLCTGELEGTYPTLKDALKNEGLLDVMLKRRAITYDAPAVLRQTIQALEVILVAARPLLIDDEK
jgi:hypothetical protein